jgi:hypothetical protein
VPVKDQFIRQGSRLCADIAAATRPVVDNKLLAAMRELRACRDVLMRVGACCGVWGFQPPRSPTTINS